MERNRVHRFGDLVISGVEAAGLVVILVATLVAGGQEILHMIRAGVVTLTDLLLLFIYLEVVTMIGVYWQSGKLPVRMPLYIAMVALARYLILDTKEMESLEVLGVAGGILVLAFAVLVVRYGHLRFPYPTGERSGHIGRGTDRTSAV